MEDYIFKLRQIGLTDYEAKSYVCMLTSPNLLSAAEISRLTKVPRTKIYDVLRSLIQKGFCVEEMGNIRKYKAISPKYAFEKIIKEIDGKKQLISNMTNELSTLARKMETNNSHQTLEIVREENQIIEKVDWLTENTLREIIGMKKPPFDLEAKQIEAGNHIKGDSSISYKYIYEIKGRENADFINLLQIFQNEGAEIRVISKLPVSMEIYDNKILRISLKEKVVTQIQCFSLFSKNPDLVLAFRELFKIYYQKAESLKKYLRRIRKI